MPLIRQEFDLPLVAGLAQNVRSESREVPAGFETLTNTVQDKAGAYTKRPGSTTYAAGPTAAISMHGLRDQVPLVNSGKVLSAHGKGAWTERGGVPGLDVTRTGLHSVGVPRDYGGAIGITSPVIDTAQANGVVVVLFASPTALYAECFDATTKAPLLGPSLLHALLGVTPYVVAAQVMPTIVAVGNKIVAIWRRISWMVGVPEDALWFSVLDTANVSGGWSAAAQLIGAGVLSVAPYVLLAGGPPARAVAVGMATRFAIAVLDVAGVVLLRTYTDAGVLIASAQPIATANPPSFGVCGVEGRHIWLAVTQATVPTAGNVDLVAVNPVSLAVTGAVLASAWPQQPLAGQNERCELVGLVTTDTDRCAMVVGNYHENPGAPLMRQGYLGWRHFRINGAGNVAASTATSSAYNLHPFAVPFAMADGRFAVVATPYDTFNNPSTNDQFVRNWQKGLFVVDVSNARYDYGDVQPLASVAPRVCTANSGYQIELWIKQMPSMPSGHALAVPVMRSGQTEAIELVEVVPSTSASSGEVGGNLHLSGGVAWQYDGEKPIESAFLETPRIRCEALSAGPGITGVFYYVAVYEHVDAAGNLHQSAPSAPVTPAAVPANQTVNLVITTGNTTYRAAIGTGADRTRIVLYRTEAGGSTYYRYKEFDNYDPTGATWFRGYVTFADVNPDASAYYGQALSTRPRLYTQPGTLGTALPRVAPSSLSHVVQHGDVIAGIGDSGRRIWISAPRVEGEGAWFSDAMVVEVEDTSPLVALASLDGRLFAFTATGIHVIDGAGFAENGTGGYSLPQRLATDAGCSDSRSVVSTPGGILFLSPSGLCLLSRAGQVTLFGGAVQDTLAAFPTVQAATLDPLHGRVLFQCVSGASAGVTLVYDYVSAVWTTYARADALAAKGAAVIGGVYHWVSSAGLVRQESASWVDDGATWQGQTWTTGWVQFTGLQGYQRIWRVLLRLVRRSSHDLKVSFAFDYSDTYAESKTFTDAEIAALGPAGPYTLELAPSRQRCQAMRVKIEEQASVVGTGRGAELVGIRFVWAKEARTTFPAASKR